MKTSSILIMVLAAGALGAQDAPKLDGRIQVFAELSRPTQITVAQPGGDSPDVKDQPKRQIGGGIRFLGELASHPGWYYEIGGMFDAASYFTYNGNIAPVYTLDMTGVKVSDSYWSLGGAYMGKIGDSLTWGAHLEGRGEHLRISGQANYNGTVFYLNQGNTYLRPWVRGSFDYTFTSIGAEKHPYVGLEGSYALLRTSQISTPDLSNFDDRNLRSLAPRASAALYAGIRF